MTRRPYAKPEKKRPRPQKQAAPRKMEDFLDRLSIALADAKAKTTPPGLEPRPRTIDSTERAAGCGLVLAIALGAFALTWWLVNREVLPWTLPVACGLFGWILGAMHVPMRIRTRIPAEAEADPDAPAYTRATDDQLRIELVRRGVIHPTRLQPFHEIHVLGPHDFAMKHPLSCELQACEFHRVASDAVQTGGFEMYDPGAYRMDEPTLTALQPVRS